MQGESDSKPGDAEAGDQWSDLEPQLVQGHEKRKCQDHHLCHANQQQFHRCFQVVVVEPLLQQGSYPASHEGAGGKNDGCTQHLEAVSDGVSQHEVGQ
ncbi:MAG TPA: hypothetical protein VJ805_00650 [Nitrospiraceae bacterium]|nr:hypothetical protein [Nitrospiraceae bacterium]